MAATSPPAPRERSGSRRLARRQRQRGVTLMELLVAVTILVVLAMVALPAYRDYVMAGRRADGKAALHDLANRMERYNAQNYTYVGATIASGNASTDVLSRALSPGGWYTLSISSASASAYTLLATRTAAQTADSSCGDLTLTSAGVQGVANASQSASQCW